MSVGEKLTAIAANEEKVYAAGAQAAENRCKLKHHIIEVEGDGSTRLVFDLPFDPDFLCITGFHPDSYSTTNAAILLVAEMASLAHRWSVCSSRLSSGGLDSYVLKPSSVHSRCYRQDDGSYVLCNLPSTAGVPYFVKGMPYVIMAIKYVDKSLAERLTEYVLSLTGSGTVTLDGSKVHAAFSDEQWQALIAQRPDWTITLI